MKFDMALQKKFQFWVMVLLPISLLVGCGDSGRFPIKGSVKFDGTPVKKGYIVILPMPGTEGPAAGSDIIDGTFNVSAEKGVFEGHFKVEIKGWRESKKMTEDFVTGEKYADPVQFLPAKFNTKSELTMDVEADKESYDFNLEP